MNQMVSAHILFETRWNSLLETYHRQYLSERLSLLFLTIHSAYRLQQTGTQGAAGGLLEWKDFWRS